MVREGYILRERRQVKADLIGFLREDWLIRKGITTNRTGIILTPKTVEGITLYRNDSYFCWNYYIPSDIVGVTYPPVIYDGGVVVDPTKYYVHFLYGEITFSGYTPSGAITADFSHLPYAIIEADDMLFDKKDSPFSYIVIQKLTVREVPLQLSGGVFQYYDFILELGSYHRESPTLARARTDDLVEYIKRGLDYIPLIDYTVTFALDGYGDRIASYDRNTQEIGRYQLIENLTTDMEIPNYEDVREIARHSLTFTLLGVADTT